MLTWCKVPGINLLILTQIIVSMRIQQMSLLSTGFIRYSLRLTWMVPLPMDTDKMHAPNLKSLKLWELGKVIDCEDDMNVIISTWAFKVKWYPDGLIKKFKAILCARGYMQLGGMYFFKTYASFVQCTTITFMLILEVLLQLKPNQGDITAAFLHSKLEENEKKYFSICQKDLSSMKNVEIEGY